MADAPVEAIRQSNRYYLNINRKKLKDGDADVRRAMAEMQLEDIDVATLAGKLKTKSTVTAADLHLLKNALMRDLNGIPVVLATEGALRGIVRELTGSEVNRQMAAAGCLCNLALGESRACVAIAKAAAAYLVAALDSYNDNIAMSCAWTLGNLCGSGEAASELVSAAGAVGRLCGMVPLEGERADAAVYALTLLAHARGDLLSREHLDIMIKSVAGSEVTTDFRLLFILSCHQDYSDPEELVQRKCIARFPDLMSTHLNTCVGEHCCDLVHLLRTLANMEGGNVYFNFVSFIRRDEQLTKEFKRLLADPFLKTTMLWLCGNMLCRQDHRRFIKHFDYNSVQPVEEGEVVDEVEDVVEEVPEVLEDEVVGEDEVFAIEEQNGR